jgi:hypothetical protein
MNMTHTRFDGERTIIQPEQFLSVLETIWQAIVATPHHERHGQILLVGDNNCPFCDAKPGQPHNARCALRLAKKLHSLFYVPLSKKRRKPLSSQLPDPYTVYGMCHGLLNNRKLLVMTQMERPSTAAKLGDNLISVCRYCNVAFMPEYYYHQGNVGTTKGAISMLQPEPPPMVHESNCVILYAQALMHIVSEEQTDWAEML